jgi:flagellar basal-body rod protein FlgF
MMLRGLYGSAAGMIAQQQRQEMLSNNVANANTPGFKADQASLRTFPNMLIKAMDISRNPGNRSNVVGELSTGVYLQERMPNFLQGDINETGNNTDIALLEGQMPLNEDGRPGSLFFTVQNQNGEERYSRDGSLAVDGQGFLVSSNGFYLLNTAGNPIQVDNENFRVAQDGTILHQNGDNLGQVGVAFAEDPMQLVKEGNGLFRLEAEGQDALPPAIGNDGIAYQLNQGFIERSNVDAAQTMTEMMNAIRSFEANQKVLQAYDRSLEKAVNEVGRLG